MLDVPPTPRSTLQLAHQIGIDSGLDFVYEGNIGVGGEDTLCSGCGSQLISRAGFSIRKNRLVNGRCPDCGVALPGIWK